MAQRAYYDVLIPFGQIKRLKEILLEEENLNVFINPLSHYENRNMNYDNNSTEVENLHDPGIVKEWERVQIRVEVNILGEQHRKNIETLIKVYDGEIFSVHNIGELPLMEKVKIFLKAYTPLAATVYTSGVVTSLIGKWNDIFSAGDVMGVVSIMALNLLTATSAVLIVVRFKNL